MYETKSNDSKANFEPTLVRLPWGGVQRLARLAAHVCPSLTQRACLADLRPIPAHAQSLLSPEGPRQQRSGPVRPDALHERSQHRLHALQLVAHLVILRGQLPVGCLDFVQLVIQLLHRVDQALILVPLPLAVPAGQVASYA